MNTSKITNMFLTLKRSISYHLVYLCLLIVIMYMPNMEIINPSDNVPDLGIFMYSNCSFEFHIKNLCKKCSNLAGWILRTFTVRHSIVLEVHYGIGLKSIWKIENNMYVTAIFHL